MRRRLASESGTALVVAMMVIALMLTAGLAAMSLADGQTGVTTKEHTQESTFNLADAVLRTQVYLLASNWPGSATSAYPSSCTQSSTSALCPDASTMSSEFSSSDYAAGISWTTQVQDDGGSVASYYTTAGAAGQPNYDANGDGKVWIRAQATVHGQTRVLVTLAEANLTPSPFPRNVITAGSFSTTNQGRKVIVDTKGSGQTIGPITVRCTNPAQSSCLNYNPSKGQVSPNMTQTGYTGGAALSPDELNTLRYIAKANGTYYSSGCPSTPAGAMVFVESGNCSYTGGGTYNSAASPGMFIVVNGTLSLGGSVTYYGLIYAVNAQNSSGTVVSLQGNSQILGAVAVDGNGSVSAGSSGTNIVFNSNVFNSVQGYTGASVVQGTWRELPRNG